MANTHMGNADLTDVNSINLNTILNSKSVGIIGTTTGIDGTAIANTACATIDANSNGAVIIAVVVRPTTITGFAVVGTADILTSGGQTVFGAQAMTGLNSNVKQFMYGTFNATGLIAAAGQTINLNMSVGFTATTATLSVDVIGYYL